MGEVQTISPASVLDMWPEALGLEQVVMSPCIQCRTWENKGEVVLKTPTARAASGGSAVEALQGIWEL